MGEMMVTGWVVSVKQVTDGPGAAVALSIELLFEELQKEFVNGGIQRNRGR